MASTIEEMVIDGVKWYKTGDIARVLGMKNIRTSILNYDKTMKQCFPSFTPGGKQRCTFLSELGVITLLHRCRQSNVRSICDTLGIDMATQYRPHIEIQILEQICAVFKKEKVIHQFIINSYRVDIYFPDYKLAIEIDENHRQDEADAKRQKTIVDLLNCRFIRIKPYEKDFNIFTFLGTIYEHISASKQANEISLANLSI